MIYKVKLAAKRPMFDAGYSMLDRCNFAGSEYLSIIQYRESSIQYHVAAANRQPLTEKSDK